MRRFTDERGIAHIVEIVIIAVVLLGVAGFIGWRVLDANQNKPNAAQQAIANAECKKINDQDVCKFLTGWKQNTSYKVTSTQTVAGESSTSIFSATNNGANYHMQMTINGQPYEVIGIGNVLYTKDSADGKWWKQTIEPGKEADYKAGNNYTFEDPNTASDTPAAQEPQYKKIGVEACGDKTCFKYQIIDPSAADTTQFIWFDNKDYQLRRMTSTFKDSTSDQTFAYEKIAINAPSPTKDLPAGSYIVPGQSEPLSVPQ